MGNLLMKGMGRTRKICSHISSLPERRKAMAYHKPYDEPPEMAQSQQPSPQLDEAQNRKQHIEEN